VCLALTTGMVFGPMLGVSGCSSAAAAAVCGCSHAVAFSALIVSVDMAGPRHVAPSNLSVSLTGQVSLLEIEGLSLKDRDQVGLSAGRPVGFMKCTVLIGRTGFSTRFSIPEPTRSLSWLITMQPYTLATSSCLAWPLFPLTLVAHSTPTHLPHSPPWPGHASPFLLNLSGRGYSRGFVPELSQTTQVVTAMPPRVCSC